MRKTLYSIVALAMSASSAFAQYTVTGDKTSLLTNADFGADEAITVKISTYDYDMADDGLGAGGTALYGQQPVTGWTALTPTTNTKVNQSSADPAREDGTNARAAGIFAYGTEAEDGVGYLGGDTFIPPFDYEMPSGNNGKALGLVAVWGGTNQYTQDVTLPAGSYMIVFSKRNTAGTTAVTKNLDGFIADGVEYLATPKQFDTNICTDTVVFTLDAATAGKVSLGYQAGNAGSAAMPHLYYDCVKIYTINASDIDAQKAKEEKVNLLKVIEEGKQIGADTKASQAVYDNENATLADVLAAIEKQKALNEAATVDLSAYFLKNAHFTEGEVITDGICTYEYDMEKNGVTHFGMQPIPSWTASNLSDNVWSGSTSDTNPLNGRACGVFEIGSMAFMGGADFMPPMVMSDGSSEGRVLGFLTCWSKTTQYTQAVTIPAGKYTLTISYFNQAGTDNVAKNLMGFIADDGTEYLSDVLSFSTGEWKQMKIMFELDEPTSGRFTVGYQAANVGSAKMPHFFIDGISLNFVGELNFDPSLLALRAAIESGQKLLAENFNEDLKSNLQDAVDEGNSLANSNSSDVDANQAATDAINALLHDASENIAAYEKLEEFANGELQEVGDKYENIPAIFDRLETVIDDASEALQEYNLTTEQINDLIASVATIVKEGTQVTFDEAVKSGETLDEDLDITPILEGLSFESSANGWTSDNGSVSIEHGCGEIYDKSPFTVTRTLEDMPAGTYTIKTRAFYRTGANVDNYDNYQSDKSPKAFLWAGYNKTGLTNVAELAVEAAEAPANYGAAVEGSVYVPNNRTVGQQIFENDEYAPIVETTVKTVLPQKGNLNFGICADQLDATSWVVWYSFEIAYNAIDEDVAETEVEAIKEAISACLEENADLISEPSSENAQSALDSDDLKTVSNAYDALKENIAAVTELNAANDVASAAADNYAETASPEALDAYYAAQNKYDEWTSLTTPEIVALTAELQAAAQALRIPNTEGASDSNPIDFTSVIENPSYEEATGVSTTIAGWTNSGTIAFQTQNNESYSKDGSFYAERWHAAGTLDIHQTLKNLPAGVYELTVTSYCESADICLYINNSKVALNTESAEGEPKPASANSLTFEVKAGQEITFGVKGELTSSTWVCIDDWHLTYYGTDSQKELTGIESVEIASAKSIYTVAGTRVNTLQKGLNIVVENGKAKKILVK